VDWKPNHPALHAGGIQTVVEVDKRVLLPQFLPQFLTRNYHSRALEKYGEYLEGLLLQVKLDPIPAQFTRLQVELKDSEAYNSPRIVRLRSGHGKGRSVAPAAAPPVAHSNSPQGGKPRNMACRNVGYRV
jgi:hypothetical protein